jgi:hypothetical protein
MAQNETVNRSLSTLIEIEENSKYLSTVDEDLSSLIEID